MNHVRLVRVLAVAWTLAILVACILPGENLPDVGFNLADKAVHLLIFLVFGGLWMEALRRRPLPSRTQHVLLAGTAYAVFTEVLQGLLPFGRSPELYDALADGLGVFLGVALYRLLCPYWQEPPA